MDIIKTIKESVAKGLVVQVSSLKNISQQDPTAKKFSVGDEIEFEVSLQNRNPFELKNLKVSILPMKAVELRSKQQDLSVEKISESERIILAKIKGTVKENPDDAISPWTVRDYLCKVTITGEIQIPPMKFQDEELESINVLKV